MNARARKLCDAVIAFAKSDEGQRLKQQHAERLAKRSDHQLTQSAVLERLRKLDERISRIEKQPLPRTHLQRSSIVPVSSAVPDNVVEAIGGALNGRAFNKLT